MLPSLGLFGDVDCPFYEDGECSRAHCHYRHRLSSIGVNPNVWKKLDILNDEISKSKSEAIIEIPPLRPTYIPTPLTAKVRQAAHVEKISEAAAKPVLKVDSVIENVPKQVLKIDKTEENIPKQVVNVDTVTENASKQVLKIDQVEDKIVQIPPTSVVIVNEVVADAPIIQVVTTNEKIQTNVTTETEKAPSENKRKAEKCDSKSSKVRKKEDGSREHARTSSQDVKVKDLGRDRQKKLDEIKTFLSDMPDLISTIHTALKQAQEYLKTRESESDAKKAAGSLKDWYAEYCESTGRKHRKCKEEKHKSETRHSKSDKRRPSSSDKKDSSKDHRPDKTRSERHRKSSESDCVPSSLDHGGDMEVVEEEVPTRSLPVPFASVPQPLPTKLRIAPVNAALLMGLKRNLKIPPIPVKTNGVLDGGEGGSDPRAKPARVQHDQGNVTSYLPIYSIGSPQVRTAHRQLAANSLFDAFVDKNVFVSKSEAGLEAAKIEQGIFDKHRDSYKMYSNRCFAAKKSIRTGCYKNNIRQSGPRECDVYDILVDRVLPMEELIQFGFPIKLGEVYKCHFDSRFSFNHKWASVKSALEKGERYCTRCFKTYEVDDDGLQLKFGCQFHPKGSRSDRRGEQQYGCGCLSRDSGCCQETYHITETITYEDTPGMVETPSSEDESYKKVFALDCEMVATNIGSELTHVVVIDYDKKVVYDSLCRPQGIILDYLTQYSGMTEELLSPVTKTLVDVQRDLCRLIKAEAVLIGHSLDSDLRALRLCHTNVVDTSVMFGIQEVPRTDPPLLRKSSLQRLVQLHLNRTIQDGTSGHSAEEDAVAALDLALKKANIT